MASDPTLSASSVLRQGKKTHSSPTACHKLPRNFATRNPQPGARNLCTSSANLVSRPAKQGLRRHDVSNLSDNLISTLASILRRSLDGSLLLARIRSAIHACEVFARHHLTGMLAPSLKGVNPQSLMFFEIDTSSLFKRKCTIHK